MRTLTDDQRALITLSHMTEPGDEYAGQLVRERGAIETVAYSVRETIAIPSEKHAAFVQRTKPRYRAGIVDETLAACERHGIDLLFPGDHNWPTTVNDLGDGMPLMLYVRGTLGWSKANSVALVGARAATSYGEHVATQLAADLAVDHIVISGAAYGIDGAAHRGVLAWGGETIAVLAGGIDRPYPAGHAQLIERIIANGTVISEVPPGSSPTKWRFLQRNRIIAALGQATIVVEAGFRSGSLNTIGHAVGLGRPIGAVPGPITSAASIGCHRVIKEFSGRLIETAADVRALTGANQREVSSV